MQEDSQNIKKDHTQENHTEEQEIGRASCRERV